MQLVILEEGQGLSVNLVILIKFKTAILVHCQLMLNEILPLIINLKIVQFDKILSLINYQALRLHVIQYSHMQSINVAHTSTCSTVVGS